MKKYRVLSLLFGFAIVCWVCIIIIATSGHNLKTQTRINFLNIENYLERNSRSLDFLFKEWQRNGPYDGKWLAEKLLLDPSGEGLALLSVGCWDSDGARDLWGTLLRCDFTKLKDGQVEFKLWSAGKNRIDDLGLGDDIVLTHVVRLP